MSLRGQYILEEPDAVAGRLNHIEGGLRYLSLCGQQFDPDGDTRRVPYVAPPPEDLSLGVASHVEFCTDCHTIRNRRAVEGNGGVLA